MVKTDEELYKDFLKGDKTAFEKIVERHRINMIYFISGYTKDTTTAEDIVQDAFVYLLTNKEYYNSKYKLKSYLYTIAKSRAINHLNKFKKESNINDSFDTEFNTEIIDTINLTDQIHNKEKLKQINEIIHKLKPDYQSVIYLSDFEGMNTSEICRILKKSQVQVRALLYNAKKSLKKLLKEEGISYDE